MLINKLRYSKRQITRYTLFYFGKIAFWTPANYPDFLCVGAARAGTTWLHNRLSLHPDIFLHGIKELNFFNDPEPSSNSLIVAPLFKKIIFDLKKKSHWRWYFLIFNQGKNKIKGDITPSYLIISKEKINVIKENMPDVKIIMLIRNPIDRAWSNLRRVLWFNAGQKPSDLGSMENIKKELLSQPILIRGEYKTCLQNWETFFDTSQIKYIFFNDLFKNPRMHLNEICDFIGVDKHLLSGESQDQNKINEAPHEVIPIGLHEDLAAYYKPHIHYLENKFQRDLSAWLSL